MVPTCRRRAGSAHAFGSSPPPVHEPSFYPNTPLGRRGPSSVYNDTYGQALQPTPRGIRSAPRLARGAAPIRPPRLARDVAPSDAIAFRYYNDRCGRASPFSAGPRSPHTSADRRKNSDRRVPGVRDGETGSHRAPTQGSADMVDDLPEDERVVCDLMAQLLTKWDSDDAKRLLAAVEQRAEVRRRLVRYSGVYAHPSYNRQQGSRTNGLSADGDARPKKVNGGAESDGDVAVGNGKESLLGYLETYMRTEANGPLVQQQHDREKKRLRWIGAAAGPHNKARKDCVKPCTASLSPSRPAPPAKPVKMARGKQPTAPTGEGASSTRMAKDEPAPASHRSRLSVVETTDMIPNQQPSQPSPGEENPCANSDALLLGGPLPQVGPREVVAPPVPSPPKLQVPPPLTVFLDSTAVFNGERGVGMGAASVTQRTPSTLFSSCSPGGGADVNDCASISSTSTNAKLATTALPPSIPLPTHWTTPDVVVPTVGGVHAPDKGTNGSLGQVGGRASKQDTLSCSTSTESVSEESFVKKDASDSALPWEL